MADDFEIAPADILAFWFSDEVKEKWFEPDAAFDDELKKRFEPALENAKLGALMSWSERP